jgi:hypothetical protein
MSISFGLPKSSSAQLDELLRLIWILALHDYDELGRYLFGFDYGDHSHRKRTEVN